MLFTRFQKSPDFSPAELDHDNGWDAFESPQTALPDGGKIQNSYAAMRGQGGRKTGYFETNSNNAFDNGDYEGEKNFDEVDPKFIEAQNLNAVTNLGPMDERVNVLEDIIQTSESTSGPVNRSGYINRLRSRFPNSTVAREVVRQLEQGYGDMSDFAHSVGDIVRYGAAHLSQETSMRRFQENRPVSAKAVETAKEVVAQTGGLSPFAGQNGQRIDDAVANYKATPAPVAAPVETAKPSLWSRATNKMSQLAEKATETVSNISNSISQKAMNVVNSASNTLNRVTEKFAPTVNSVSTAVKGKVGSVMSKVGGWFKSSGGNNQEAFAY
ncbi:MAG: hypothetical protein AAB373_00715 [Patescibacteria group bacterium]